MEPRAIEWSGEEPNGDRAALVENARGHLLGMLILGNTGAVRCTTREAYLIEWDARSALAIHRVFGGQPRGFHELNWITPSGSKNNSRAPGFALMRRAAERIMIHTTVLISDGLIQPIPGTPVRIFDDNEAKCFIEGARSGNFDGYGSAVPLGSTQPTAQLSIKTPDLTRIDFGIPHIDDGLNITYTVNDPRRAARWADRDHAEPQYRYLIAPELIPNLADNPTPRP
jgi:hypothetical protein